MFRTIRRALFSWRLFNTFGDNQLLRFVKAPPSIVIELGSIVFIASVGILTACLTAMAVNKLLQRRVFPASLTRSQGAPNDGPLTEELSNHRVGPRREAKSISKFTFEIKLRRPDEIVHGEEEPEKRRERELKKWREEHRAQLEPE